MHEFEIQNLNLLFMQIIYYPHISWIRKRGPFRHLPGFFHVTQLMNYKDILFPNLDSTFQIQFCVYSTLKTQLATKGLTWKNV